ncbi:ABC transporter permease subunit [Candidatus Woesearchaeota archaeon]|nr:ABC transporter permease subunit [Candidatus Woesearchaeota archaeon]
MRKLYRIIFGIIILIFIWEIIVLLSGSIFLPSSFEIGKGFVKLLDNIYFYSDIGATLIRMFLGLIISILIGIPLGLFFGYYGRIYLLFEFIIDFLRSIPPPTLFPLFMLIFGIGNVSKIAPVVFMCTFFILINTMYGVKNVKDIRLKTGKLFRLSKFSLVKNIIIPEALPYIAAGLRISISLSLILSIVFEMFVGTKYGIGQRIINFQLLYDIPEMYAMIIVAGLFGYIVNNVFVYYEKKTIHWSGK